MKLWLDDVRDPKAFGLVGWTWVQTATQAIDLLKTGLVSIASLDHDLGFVGHQNVSALGLPPEILEVVPDGKSGYDVVVWLEQHPEYMPKNGVHVHSQNPAGAARMRTVLANMGKLVVTKHDN
jgi:hypothetical protein